jgi:hypothetical protein
MVEALISKEYRVIKYPDDESVYSRYYVSLDKNLCVGLKLNRLKNSNIFPYLVTCYKSDHMQRPRSETYKYYNKTTTSNLRRYSTVPIRKQLLALNLNNHYCLQPAISETHDNFYCALSIATNFPFSLGPTNEASHSFSPGTSRKASGIFGKDISTHQFPYWPYLVKQEAWQHSDNEIMNIIRGNDTPVVGSVFFRYFEELLHVSIHVCTIFQGEKHMIPDHISPYIWTDPYAQHIVLFEHKKRLYGDNLYSYQILTRKADGSTVFGREDPAVQQIIAEKRSLSVAAKDFPNVESQIIDENGKCRIIRQGGRNIDVLTRPLHVPVMQSIPCPLITHITYMNRIKQNIKAPLIDITRCSTSKLRYFPDNDSFVSWYHTMLD